jgi:hypothetical protein
MRLLRELAIDKQKLSVRESERGFHRHKALGAELSELSPSEILVGEVQEAWRPGTGEGKDVPVGDVDEVCLKLL